jgi:hypothetical protein
MSKKDTLHLNKIIEEPKAPKPEPVAPANALVLNKDNTSGKEEADINLVPAGFDHVEVDNFKLKRGAYGDWKVINDKVGGRLPTCLDQSFSTTAQAWGAVAAYEAKINEDNSRKVI